MKKQVTIEVEVEVEVEIPDAIIPEILEEYIGTIDPMADEDCLFERVAHAMTFGKYSGEDFVEGIGSLGKQGIKWEEIGVSTVINRRRASPNRSKGICRTVPRQSI